MHGGEPFKKLYTEYGYEEGTFPWFPKLTLNKPTNKGYYNLLFKDGNEIYEYIDDPAQNTQRKAEGNESEDRHRQNECSLIPYGIDGNRGFCIPQTRRRLRCADWLLEALMIVLGG